ncbi:hypothetical protein AWB64_04661 [Caballeronia sordidicola]|uniref:DUF4148 domain-containing protein n=1 Tax=Caballeronia sordidicola TaxID=196367 RepID=A0A158HHG8_CABSO|nr:hypothetical protein [Caballeronia sordidicola]SAL43828.1 hypothetical protein AWB64_04661 [Caballeronia sordidicola]
MKKNLIATLLIATSAALAAPAFASSGYGPAPSYNPTVGAPASQRGQSAQTVAAENAQANAEAKSYGGVQDTQSQSGSRVRANTTQSLYSHN